MNKTANIQKNKTRVNAEDQAGPMWQRVLRVVLVSLSILAMVGFWGTFVYGIVVQNIELLKILIYVIAIAAGVFGMIHFLFKFSQHISRS